MEPVDGGPAVRVMKHIACGVAVYAAFLLWWWLVSIAVNAIFPGGMP